MKSFFLWDIYNAKGIQGFCFKISRPSWIKIQNRKSEIVNWWNKQEYCSNLCPKKLRNSSWNFGFRLFKSWRILNLKILKLHRNFLSEKPDPTKILQPFHPPSPNTQKMFCSQNWVALPTYIHRTFTVKHCILLHTTHVWQRNRRTCTVYMYISCAHFKQNSQTYL